MDLITILLVAVALAMDCFAVALAACIRPEERMRNATRIALAFGLFQGGMPVLGWLAGRTFSDLISGFDHWVAFGLLAIVGLRMIRGGMSADMDQKTPCLDTTHLLFLSVATSIDALAVGVSFAFLDTGILLPCLIIGVSTFTISFLGAVLGGAAAERWGKAMEVLGGLVLLGIGIRILFTHMVH
ncbi:MAG TPA: manganese efflux pump MntP family protein [Methanomicrobiales archaeon]|nr:manganese efflux pump MntP family protein [Methanomicrobiales archaeon]